MSLLPRATRYRKWIQGSFSSTVPKSRAVTRGSALVWVPGVEAGPLTIADGSCRYLANYSRSREEVPAFLLSLRLGGWEALRSARVITQSCGLTEVCYYRAA